MWMPVDHGSNYPASHIAPEPIYRHVPQTGSFVPQYLWKSATDGNWHINQYIGPRLELSTGARLYLLPIAAFQVWGLPTTAAGISGHEDLVPKIVQTPRGFIYVNPGSGAPETRAPYENCLTDDVCLSPVIFYTGSYPTVTYVSPAGYTPASVALEYWLLEEKGVEFYYSATVAGTYTRRNRRRPISGSATMTATLIVTYPFTTTSLWSPTLEGSYPPSGGGLATKYVGWKTYRADPIGYVFHEVDDSLTANVYPTADESLFVWYNAGDDRWYCSDAAGTANPATGYWKRDDTGMLGLYEYYVDPGPPVLDDFTLSLYARVDASLLSDQRQFSVQLAQADNVFNRVWGTIEKENLLHVMSLLNNGDSYWYAYIIDKLTTPALMFLRMLSGRMTMWLYSMVQLLIGGKYLEVPLSWSAFLPKAWTTTTLMSASGANFYFPTTAVHTALPLDLDKFRQELGELVKLPAFMTHVLWHHANDGADNVRIMPLGWGNPVIIHQLVKSGITSAATGHYVAEGSSKWGSYYTKSYNWSLAAWLGKPVKQQVNVYKNDGVEDTNESSADTYWNPGAVWGDGSTYPAESPQVMMLGEYPAGATVDSTSNFSAFRSYGLDIISGDYTEGLGGTATNMILKQEGCRIYNHGILPVKVHFYRIRYWGETKETEALNGSTVVNIIDQFDDAFSPPQWIGTVDVAARGTAEFDFAGLLEVLESEDPGDPMPVWATGARIGDEYYGSLHGAPRWPPEGTNPGEFVYTNVINKYTGLPDWVTEVGTYSRSLTFEQFRSLRWTAVVEKVLS